MTIQNHLPMRADMTSRFTIEAGIAQFSEMQLIADGSRSQVTGEVDLGHWPEQTWRVQSRVHFPRMREIFFTKERWRLAGDGDFTGTFHLFKGGRELKGTFASAEAGVNEYRFQALQGSLVWLPQKFEVTDATSRVYGGTARFSYLMAPIGTRTPTKAVFDATYRDVDLGAVQRQPRAARHPLHRPRDGTQPHGVAARPVLGRAARQRPGRRSSRPRGTWCSAGSLPAS